MLQDKLTQKAATAQSSRQKVQLAMLAIIAAVLFTACGGGKSDDARPVPKTDTAPADARLYQATSSVSGNTVEVWISRNEAPDVYLNQTRITRDAIVQFDPALSANGIAAWVESVSGANGATEIVVHEHWRAPSDRIQMRPVFVGARLYWLRHAADQSEVCSSAVATFDLTCRSLGMWADDLSTLGDLIAATGLDPSSGDYSLQLLDPSSLVIVDKVLPQAPAVLGRNGVFRIRGTGTLLPLMWFYRLYLGPQQNDPWVYSNNDLGRLSWNAAYRLHATTTVQAVHPDDNWLTKRVRDQAGQLLARAAETPGLFPVRKYSIGGDTQLSLAVTDARVVNALLSGQQALSSSMVAEVLDLADQLWAREQQNWTANRLFKATYGIDYTFDGVWLPWNQQHSLGLVGLELAKARGAQGYEAQLMDLYWGFRQELVQRDGGYIWHYWPELFYKGWNEQDAISRNTPSRDPYDDQWFEDVNHGAKSLEFVNAIDDHNGWNRTLDIDYLVERLATDNELLFYRFLGADDVSQTPSMQWLPIIEFARSERMQALLQRWIPRPWIDFDNQGLMLTYAIAHAELIAKCPSCPPSQLFIDTLEPDLQTWTPQTIVSTSDGIVCEQQDPTSGDTQVEACSATLRNLWLSKTRQ
jgi:hypothetical protein